MAIYSLLTLGMTVVGGPFVGWVSQHWSPRVGIGLAGAVTLVTAAVLWAVGSGRGTEVRGVVVLPPGADASIGDLAHAHAAVGDGPPVGPYLEVDGPLGQDDVAVDGELVELELHGPHVLE